MTAPGHTLDRARAARLLDVEETAADEVVRAAFRAAVKAVHPDRPGGDVHRLRAVIEAYDLLRGQPAPVPATLRHPPPPPILEISPLEAFSGGRRALRAADGRDLAAYLPAGLRAGDQVRIAGEIMTVTVSAETDLAVIGDHLCVTIDADQSLLRHGGLVTLATPLGRRTVRVTRQDGLRGIVRLAGEGLPPRGARPRGDLLVRLRPAPETPAAETAAQAKLRRFTAVWAA